MKIPAAALTGIGAMLRLGASVEVEAVLTDDLLRADAQRVLRAYSASAGRVPPSDALDATIAGPDGASLRVTCPPSGARAMLVEFRDAVACITKSRAADPVLIPEYGLRVNAKRETPVPVSRGLAALKAAASADDAVTLRLKRRFSFELAAGGARLDVTAVRQLTAPLHRSDPLARVRAAPERYEMEVEVLDAAKCDARALLRHCTSLLKTVEAAETLLSKSEKAAALSEFDAMRGGDAGGGLGPKPVTLDHCAIRSIAEGAKYTVTDKADGERRALVSDAEGRAFTVDDRRAVRALPGATMPPRCWLDGEWVRGGRFAAFDAYVVGDASVRSRPLDARLELARRALAEGSVSARAHVKAFEFFQGRAEMARACARVFARRDSGALPYAMDGLIFTPAACAVGADRPGDPSPGSRGWMGAWASAYKWKPAEMNTIDFLVRLGTDVVSDGRKAYREARLFVGDAKGAVFAHSALSWITRGGPAGGARGGPAGGPRHRAPYVAVQFDATGRPACCRSDRDDLGVAYLELDEAGRPTCEEDGSEVLDNTVVEFRFDAAPAPKMTLGRRWRALRQREDKTAQYALTGAVTANNARTARGVWSGVVSPVTEAHLTDASSLEAAAAAPSEPADAAAAATYYCSDSRAMPAMRKFNNAVKRDVLLVPAGRAVRARSLFDFGVGRAGDLNKWVEMGLERVVGVDATADPEAYARLADARAPRLRAIFLPIDASWPLSDPATFDRLDEASGDREVARALWGLGAPSDPRLRAYHLFAAPGTFDVASAMFMVHYLFDEEARLRGFCANVARVLRPGGVFVGCCMDGARVRALLGSPPRPREGRDGDALDWRITPRWGAAPGGPYGHRIDVYVRSIGREVPEYLVDMGTLTREMAAAGMHPLAREAALGMGMPRGVSTGLFLDLPSFARAGMQSHEAEYASLARWFAFAKST